MKKRIISILLTTTLVSSLLVGCGKEQDPMMQMKKEEIIEAYHTLEIEKQQLDVQYSDLQQMYYGIQSEESPTAAISITGDGSNRLTFNSVDSKIIFPSSFNYPGAEQSVADGSLSIVNGVTVKTGSNWISKLNGTSLEVEHSTGISGTIKVGKIPAVYPAASLQSDIISPWLESLPQPTIKYTNIFSGGNQIGCQASTPTLIDSEDAYMICGMMAMGQYSVVYTFVYRGNEDLSKNESISTILNSITILGSNVSVEQ